MPSKRQRRRREKTFRHDYGFVTYDEEGNEVEVERKDFVPEKPSKPKPAAASAKGGEKGKGSGRSLKPAPPPSWNRSLRKGGMWGAGMLLLAIFFFHTMPIAERIILGLAYGAAFIPLTYWIDRTAYRSYLKRSGKS
jgi:hypothetical protein